jgi:Tol biopolymer transport system component/DNA-binding winged helix-turn-helix (wHTH) protein
MKTQEGPWIYGFGGYRLDPGEQRLLRDGQPVPLTPKVFELLRVLVQNAGHLVEKERLLKQVWADTFVEEASLNRGISVLRKALGEGPADQKYIETVPKRGYRFIAPVRLIAAQETQAEDVSSGASAPAVQALPPDAAPAWPARTVREPRKVATAAAAILVIGALAYAVVGRSTWNAEPIAAGPSVHRQLTFTGKEITPTLSPDGKRIAYVSIDSPHRRVLVQELSGGRPVTVFSAPEVGWLRWSPDGTELLFWARGDGLTGTYVVPQLGGSARKIAGGAFVACWSPDSSAIAIGLFVAGKIRIVSKSGQQQRTITLPDKRSWIADLDWSPAHGRLLVVDNSDQGRSIVWTMQSDGSDQTKVVEAETEISAARWTPAGDAIYYKRRVHQTFSLYKANAKLVRESDDGNAAPLISGLESDGSFGVSAEGTRLVYARTPYHSNLWLVDLRNSERGPKLRQTQLTHGTSLVERPRVSPDGKSIVFNKGYESRADLYVVAADGGIPRRLTYLDSYSVGASWSPDGRSLAFASTNGGQARVWLVDADGSSPRPISTGAMSDNYEISWSPGPHVVYQQVGYRNFYVVDPRTRQERLLIKDSSVGWATTATSSPDGKKIVVGWNREPMRGLWLIDLASGHEAPIEETSPLLPIGWSNDGTSIYAFDGKRAAHRGLSASFGETVTEAKIVKVPLNGGPPTTVVELPFEEVGGIAMFPDGRRFVCTVYSSRSDVWIVEHFDATADRTVARRAP